MQIEVRVFCGLESCIPGIRYGQPMRFVLPEGTTGLELLEKINIPREKTFTLLINGLQKDFNTTLAEGDRVSIFPPVGGG